MKHVLLAAVMAVILSACAGDKATRATNALGIACKTHAEALRQVTPLKPKMAPDTISIVDTSVSLVRPVCSQKSKVIDPKTAVGIVESGIALLTDVKEKL